MVVKIKLILDYFILFFLTPRFVILQKISIWVWEQWEKEVILGCVYLHAATCIFSKGNHTVCLQHMYCNTALFSYGCYFHYHVQTLDGHSPLVLLHIIQNEFILQSQFFSLYI